MTLDVPPSDEPLRGAGPWRATVRFWQRIVVFSGRASISEYWWPVLVNTLIAIALGLATAVLFGVGAALEDAGSTADAVPRGLGAVVGLLLAVFAPAATLAGVAVSIRRLHDADLTGWLVLTSLVPSVGWLIMLVLSLLPANARGRRYDRGAAPASEAADPALGAPRDRAPDPAPAARALHEAWAGVGAVEVLPPQGGTSGSRGRGRLLVTPPGGAPLLATDGLHAADGAAAPGGELYLAAEWLGRDATPGWGFELLDAAAGRVRASGLRLPAELDRYGTLSMTLAGVGAPGPWRAADGSVGVLLGLPTGGVPRVVATPVGEVALVGVVPLLPAELHRILEGGAEARTRLAGRLAAMPGPARAARADPAPVSGSGGPAGPAAVRDGAR